jgi:predicted AAA+ superfamily ATPase
LQEDGSDEEEDEYNAYRWGHVMAAVLDEWNVDVSRVDEQRAALQRQWQELAREKEAVQQLIVGMAGMAKSAQQDAKLAGWAVGRSS